MFHAAQNKKKGMGCKMLEPKEIEIEANGKKKKFIISKFNAIEGREIITQYPTTALPKIGDYKTNEDLMLKIMKYVEAVADSGVKIQLTSRDLINNHVVDWEILVKIEYAVLEYNCDFLASGKAIDFFNSLIDLAFQKITSTLTASSGKLSQAEEPRSTN
jgi:hypothetical protein